MFSGDRIQAPIRRLFCLTRRNSWESRKIAKPARKPSCCWRRDLRRRPKASPPLPPPRPDAGAEAHERHRCVIWIRPIVIGIRPIIGWPREIVRLVVSAVTVAIVVPIAAPGAQVCRFRRVNCLNAKLRRSRGGRLNRRQSGQGQAPRNDHCSDQCLHRKLLMIPQGADQRTAGARVSCHILARKNRPAPRARFADVQRNSAPDITSGANAANAVDDASGGGASVVICCEPS
jgi:hypothetical protein